MHSKARLKKLETMRCQRIDVELYKNFYTKKGVQIRTTLDGKKNFNPTSKAVNGRNTTIVTNVVHMSN